MIIYLTIILALLILAYLLRCKEMKKFSPILLFIILQFLVFNTNNPDFEVYKMIFDYNDPNGIADIGFKTLISIVKFWEINNYNFILLILSILIFYTFIRWEKHIYNFSFVVLLYFIFPFIMDIIQIRNTFMMFFVLNAILDYINEKYIRCFIVLIIATTFHAFGIVFLIMMIIIYALDKNFKNRGVLDIKLENNKKIYRGIIAICIINIIFGRKIVNIIASSFPIDIVRVKLQTYIRNDLNIDSLLIWGGILLVDLIVFYKVIKKSKYIIDSSNNRVIRILYLFMFVGIILIGSMLYLSEFNRSFRALFVIKYILYGAIYKYLSRRDRIYMSLYLLLITFIMALSYYFAGIEYDNILKSNIFF